MRNKFKFNEKLKKCTAFLLALFMVLSLIPTAPAQAETTLYNEATLSISKTSKEYDLTPAGVNKKGVIYHMTLDGSKGFCLDAGKHASSGKQYARMNEKVDETYRKMISWALYSDLASNYAKNTPGVWNDVNYALAQALVWGYQEGCSTYEMGKMINIIMSDVNPEVWGRIPGNALESVCQRFVEASMKYNEKMIDQLYVYDSGISGNQRILTVETGFTPVILYGDVSSSKSYTVTDSVVLSIHKTDKETSKPLSGVSFDLYKDNVKVTTVTTDANGNAGYTFKTESTKTATSSVKKYCRNYDELSIPNKKLVDADYYSKADAQAAADAEALTKAKAEAEKLYSEKHTYKAVETKTKDAYYLNPTTATQSTSYASGDGSGTVTLQFTNARQTGSIEITKTDSENNCLLDGAVYGLYAKENIAHPDGTTGVLYAKDSLVGTFPKTGTNGKARLDGLYLGKYYVKEITAPTGYVLSTETYDVELTYAGQNVSVTDASVTVTDEVQKGSIEVSKVDKELSNGKNASIFDSNKDGAQGDASIAGATYGLFAKEDILHPNGTTGVVTYNNVAGSVHELKATKGTDFEVKNTKAIKDALLATIKTDENGEFGFENLYNGKYYIKEIEASEGYLLDKTEYEVDLSYTNQNESAVVKSITVYETVKKQAFDLFKVGQAVGSVDLTPLKDVEFTVKLESDVIRLGWDNAPTYDVITTKEDGTGSSIELPYGTYRVKETRGLENYYLAEDFFVTVSEDSREHQSFSNNVIVNKEFSALIKIVKTDADTGKTVAVKGTEFKVKALTDVTVDGKKFRAGEYIHVSNWNLSNGFSRDTWTSNEDGYVYIDEALGAGTYQLEEVAAPEGYLLNNTPVKFKVGTSVMYETGADGKTPVITVVQSDISVKGQITVLKRGEVLTGFKNNKFIYEEKALSGAKYSIIAKENIMDPSNDGTVLYAKDTVVETLTTDVTGKAVSSKLPLGKYLVKEIEAPLGMVIHGTPKTVELKYEDEITPVVFKNASFVNERQKVVLDLNKLDLEKNTPLAGAGFTIYANKNIVNYKGEVILSKDSVVTTAVSDKNGNIAFDIELPVDVNSNTRPADPGAIDNGLSVIKDKNGNTIIGDSNAMFYMKETTRPNGYASLNTTMYLDTSYQGQKVKEFTISYDLYNEITRIALSKTDITTGKPVIGAELSIIPVDENGEPKLGEVITTWITKEDNPSTKEDESIHLVKGLEPGDYILRETLKEAAGYGYVTAEDVKFTVADTGEIQKVNMKDDFTKVEISKTDITTGNPVIGAELSIIPLDENGNPKEGETFATWITGEEPYTLEYLPIGDYILREKLNQALELGYVTAEDVKFTVTDTGEIQKVVMHDDYTKVEISKTDITTGFPVIGAQLSIVPLDENGNPKYGETFATWITEETPYYIEYLPIGDYILRETLGNASELGYVTAEEVYFTIKDTGEVQKVVMHDDYTRVEISKTDSITGEPIIGAQLSIVPLDENGKPKYGETFVTWLSSEEPYYIEYLPIGNYVLVELSAPDGYYTAENVLFEIKDTNELHKVKMKDAPILTDIEVCKIDSFTKKPVVSKDFLFGIYSDKECTQTITTVNADTTDGTVVFKDLRYGTYYIKEVKAPEGYKLSDEVKEIIIDDELKGVGEVHSFTYENTLIPIVETGDSTIVVPFLCIGIVGLFIIGFAMKKKKM